MNNKTKKLGLIYLAICFFVLYMHLDIMKSNIVKIFKKWINNDNNKKET